MSNLRLVTPEEASGDESRVPAEKIEKKDAPRVARTGTDELRNEGLSDIFSQGILRTIGGTPQVELHKLFPQVNAVAKIEGVNPGGSLDDRAAKQIILHGVSSGEIRASTHVIEATSGNMGLGLAHVCAYLGLRFTCVVDQFVQEIKVAMLKALGAKVVTVITKPDEPPLYARQTKVAELVAAEEDVFWPNHHQNVQTAEAHRLGTVPELEQYMAGPYDYLFMSLANTALIKGAWAYYEQASFRPTFVIVDTPLLFTEEGRARRPVAAECLARLSEPIRSHILKEGMVEVSEKQCVEASRRLAREEAIVAGPTSGGVLHAALSMQDRLVGKRCALVFPDRGMRHLETIFNDIWVEQKVDEAGL